MQRKLIYLMIVLTAGLTTTAVAHEPEPGALESDRVWVKMKLDVTGRYYYRGWVQERHGTILQPAFRIGADLWLDEEAPLSRVSALVGTRNSFHSKNTAAQNGPSSWYESDIIGGFQFELYERAQAELLYASISSPNGAFDTIQEINLNLTYNDQGLWSESMPHAFAVDPYMNFKFEIDGSAVTEPRGTLLQLGVEPGFNPLGGESLPLRLSFPIETGISLNNYYYLPEPFAGEDDTFGYVKAGASISMPLLFIPPDYGRWGMTLGVDYIYLGDNLETFNGGRDHDVIPRLTIGASF